MRGFEAEIDKSGSDFTGTVCRHAEAPPMGFYGTADLVTNWAQRLDALSGVVPEKLGLNFEAPQWP